MNIQFGILAPPLSKQLEGIKISKKDLRIFQLDAEQLGRLYIRGYLNSNQVAAGERLIIKRVEKLIKSKNP